MKAVLAIILLIIGATAARAGHLVVTSSNSSDHRFHAHPDITKCISRAQKDFDAYRDANGDIEMSGTQTDIFAFRKCLFEIGVTFAADR